MEEDLEKGFRRGEYCSTSCPHSPILVPVSKNASCLEEASINQSLNLTYFGVYTSPAATNIHYAVDFSPAHGSRLVQDTIEDVRFGSPKGFVGSVDVLSHILALRCRVATYYMRPIVQR